MDSRAFGLGLRFKGTLPGAWLLRGGEPGLEIRSVGRGEVDDRWSGAGECGWEALIDGAPFVAERGRAGDHRFRHGERSLCHLSADASLLLCEVDELVGWRVVLDSVLFSVALIAGYEALHAGAIGTEAGALAITAAAGGGKSTLLAELLGAGYPLFSDDVVALETRGDAPPLAHPGPPLMTVPVRVDPPPGEPIAPLGEERWVGVPAAPEPLPLAGLVVLDRRPGLGTGLARVEDPLAVLLRSLLRFPRTAERERSRFELAAAIAAHVPIWVLGAEPSVEPAALAELLQEGPLRRG